MSASADVLAQAKVEIDLGNIAEGKNVSVRSPFMLPLVPSRPLLLFEAVAPPRAGYTS